MYTKAFAVILLKISTIMLHSHDKNMFLILFSIYYYSSYVCMLILSLSLLFVKYVLVLVRQFLCCTINLDMRACMCHLYNINCRTSFSILYSVGSDGIATFESKLCSTYSSPIPMKLHTLTGSSLDNAS